MPTMHCICDPPHTLLHSGYQGSGSGIPLLMVYNDTEDHSSSALHVSPLALWILSATFGFKTDHCSSPSNFPKVLKEGRGCPRL